MKAVIILGDRGGEADVDYVHVIRFDARGRVEEATTLRTNMGEASDVSGQSGQFYALEPHFSRDVNSPQRAPAGGSQSR